MSLKLSEAIRLGSMLKPQGFEGMSGGTSCAIQAAVEAAGGDSDFMYSEAEERFPIIKALPACPVCCGAWHQFTGSEMWALYHLNDHHRWTREQIADWVESVERTHEAPVAKDGEAQVNASDSLVSDAQSLINVSK
jgi:hypothetical protein